MTAYRIGTPVVPQYVADWYEENKDDFEYNLALLINDFITGKIEDDELKSWFDSDYNSNTYPIQTLVNMHQFGYKVKEKKEKLYTVKVPNPNYPDNVSFVLCKNKSGEVSMIWTDIEGWRNFDIFQLTEEEIKSYDFAYVWRYKKEVTD